MDTIRSITCSWLAISFIGLISVPAVNAQTKSTPLLDSDNPPLTVQEISTVSRAAEEGNIDAQVRLGDAFSRRTTRSVPLDYQQATKWYNRAADQGSAVACYRLGLLSDLGYGTPQDPVAAFQLYKRGAALGLPEAQYMVGRAYTHGRGVAQNHKQAMDWLSSSSKQGFPPAQVLLAQLLQNQRGPGFENSKDKVDAYALLSAAAASSHPIATAALAQRQECLHGMTLLQIVDAEAKAQNPESQIVPPPLP
jgi:TPR repeat protein